MPHRPRSVALRPDRGEGSRRIPLLFLISDTGGGHRAAARAVGDALETLHPGRYEPVLIDPLGGPGSTRTMRAVTALYGPSIRIAPWTWGAIYYASDSKLAMRILRATVFARATRPVAAAVDELDPAAIVSFHPLVGKAAMAGRRRARVGTPVVTVVTDLVTPHTAWRFDPVDLLVVPSAAVRWRCHLDGFPTDRCVELGLPVGAAFRRGPVRSPAERADQRRRLGLRADRFVVVLTGGGEGSGGLDLQARALLRATTADVVVICGRNERVRRRIERLNGGDRLTVCGFVDNMADWLRAADVVVTKAGPGTIAEATACGAPLLITSHVPGQEKGNTEFVVGAGAGRSTPRLADLTDAVAALEADPGAVETMRVAAARLSRPDAALDIARVIARTADEAHDTATTEPPSTALGLP